MTMGATAEHQAAAALEAMTFAALRPAWDASVTLIVATVGAAHALAYQNDASRRLFGARPLGASIEEAFPELSPDLRRLADRVRRECVTVRSTAEPTRTSGVDGEAVHLTYVFSPLCPQHGVPATGVVFSASDVTAQVRSAEAAGQARLLSEISDRMNTAVDPDRALQRLTDTLVPAVADVAAVYVLPPGDGHTDVLRTGDHDRGARRGSAPVALTLSPALAARAGRPPVVRGRSAPPLWGAVLAAGKPVIIPVGQTDGRPQLQDDRARRWLHEADARSLAVLPLTLAGELAGAVVLLAAGDRNGYVPGDLPFLEQAATRAGAAVTHVRSFRHQRDIALDLQRALLPAVPAELPGMRVAARYVAGSTDVDVGGDWWDVHHRGDGRSGVGVGDVSGRGTQAAVVMGQARAAMRAAAHADLAPGRLLALLDAQLGDLVAVDSRGRASPAPPRFATAAYAVVDLKRELLCVANAGHPPLLVLRPDGTTHRVQAPPGPPLGLGLAGYEEMTAAFPAGSTLVAFTDGLVESRTTDVDTGVGQLRRHLSASGAGQDLEALADELLDRMGRRHGHDDDVALVLCRSAPAPS